MFVTVFYVVVFVSGLLGNLSVIAVVVRSKGLHSAMNYYLISLAIADVLIILLGELFFKVYVVLKYCIGKRLSCLLTYLMFVQIQNYLFFVMKKITIELDNHNPYLGK